MRRSVLLCAFMGALAIAVPLALAADGIQCPAEGACYGTPGADVIHGTTGFDDIRADSGADIVHGYSGFDIIFGATGSDTIYGEAEGDTIYGGHQGDKMYGGPGTDEIYAGCVTSCSQAGEGPDYLYGEGSADTLGADNGKKDYISCGSGTGTDHAYIDSQDVLLSGHDCEVIH